MRWKSTNSSINLGERHYRAWVMVQVNGRYDLIRRSHDSRSFASAHTIVEAIAGPGLDKASIHARSYHVPLELRIIKPNLVEL